MQDESDESDHEKYTPTKRISYLGQSQLGYNPETLYKNHLFRSNLAQKKMLDLDNRLLCLGDVESN